MDRTPAVGRTTGNANLIHKIRERIDSRPGRVISFRDYMESCLYDESYGYYCRDVAKIGKSGDYYTSSSVGTVMGEMLAKAFIRYADEFGWNRWRIVEWGGGTGRLAAQVLDAVRRRSPEKYEQLEYWLIERSPYHRQAQQETLKSHACVRHVDEAEWFASDANDAVVVFSNELIDAFPVHRICLRNGKLCEIGVTWDDSGGVFADKLVPLTDEAVLRYVADENITLKEGQKAEVNLEAVEWMRRVGRFVREGCVVTIDYGDSAEELYAPHRMEGTLMCYRNHIAHDNPYVHVGEQDMTAHVNFSALVRVGRQTSLDGSWTTQREFLTAEGVFELLSEHDGADPFGPAARMNRAVRQLLVSDRMSELFKVLVQTKKR